jgi:hypothetical protein
MASPVFRAGGDHIFCPISKAALGFGDRFRRGVGGGKTDLGIGLALTAHKRSLFLRRINKDAVKIKPRIEEILGHDNGYNGQLQRWRLGERQIYIAGCEQESDTASSSAGTALPILANAAGSLSPAILRPRLRGYGL